MQQAQERTLISRGERISMITNRLNDSRNPIEAAAQIIEILDSAIKDALEDIFVDGKANSKKLIQARERWKDIA